ncbi:MAG: sulfatase-like hydrolase/transferase [Mycobacteriaceae bacterium]|nr:sulfatase-like hydrolase/transferase [Mycobacteriaceae bacterium]
MSYNSFHVLTHPRFAVDRPQPPRERQRAVAELANDRDVHAGKIPRSSTTVAEVLKQYGYATSVFGKWHNTPAEETTLRELAHRSASGRGAGERSAAVHRERLSRCAFPPIPDSCPIPGKQKRTYAATSLI